MWNRLRCWSSDLPIHDQVERRQAPLVQVILLAKIVAAILALPLPLSQPVPALGRFLFGSAGLGDLLLTLGALVALRRGHFKLSIMMAAAGLLLLLAMVLVAAGLESGASLLLLFMVPISLTGLLAGRYALLLTLVLSVAILLVVAILERLSPPLAGFFPLPPSAASIIIGFSLTTGLICLFLDRFGASLREALAAALTREQELERVRAALERRTAELEHEIGQRVRAEEQLKRSEASLSALIENATEAVWSVDTNYRLIAFNSFFRDQFLLAFGVRIDQGMGLADMLPPETLLELYTYWARLYDRALGGERFSTEQQYDIQGRTHYYIVSLYPIITDGSVSGVAIFSQDITERKLLEEQFLQAQKMESVGRLAGGVAHDFNNLLTAIAGNAELAIEALPADHVVRADLREILNSAERATVLTRQLLAFARKQIIEPQVITLNHLIGNMDKLLRRLIGEDIDLVTLLATDLELVKADPGQIEQVVINLAINARDAMPDGGKLTIETRNVALDQDYAQQHVSVTPGYYVMLAVSDTGIGMDEETRRRIFEPFFTTKEKGRGTGLGLATCYGIVKQHGGNIWTYSEPGHGSTFKIYLPRVDEPAEHLPQTADAHELPRGTETVLLVEDEPAVRALAARVLRERGYIVLEAANGDEALHMAHECAGVPIHLLLTDVVMPHMSGKALAEQLQSLYPTIKVLFISGYTDNAIVHHGRLDAGVEFLQKPFAPSVLASKVREVLDS